MDEITLIKSEGIVNKMRQPQLLNAEANVGEP